MKTTCKTAIHRIRNMGPYEYDLNIYRGCTHRCAYCFARYSQKYLDTSKDFFDGIVAKVNIAEVLDKELQSKKSKPVLNLGGVCDSYQPAEKEMELMPGVLRTLIKHKNPCIISTKSDLILRDIELINELSKVAYVGVSFSITMNESLRRRVEPGASSIDARFQAMKRIKEETNASVGINMMPIIPYLTDSEENIRMLLERSKDAHVDYVIPGLLNLRGETRKYFLSFLRKEMPEIAEKLIPLYPTSYCERDYAYPFYASLNKWVKEYGLTTNYMKVIENKKKEINRNFEQIRLF